MKTPASAPREVTASLNRPSADSVVSASPMQARISNRRAPKSCAHVDAPRAFGSLGSGERGMAFATQLAVEQCVSESQGFHFTPPIKDYLVGEHHDLYQARSHGLPLGAFNQEAQCRGPQRERHPLVLGSQGHFSSAQGLHLVVNTRDPRSLSAQLQRRPLGTKGAGGFIDAILAPPTHW